MRERFGDSPSSQLIIWEIQRLFDLLDMFYLAEGRKLYKILVFLRQNDMATNSTVITSKTMIVDIQQIIFFV